MEKFGHLFIQPLDFAKSFAFYTEVLGMEKVHFHGEEEDHGRLAVLKYGQDFQLVLAEDHTDIPADKKPVIYNQKGRISIHFETDNVDASFDRIKKGPHVLVQPENNHWGTRWFLVEDPEGNQFGWQGPVKK